MPDTISSREETEIMNAIKSAGALVEAGSSPNDAVEKIARAQNFGPGKIRLMGQAYNTGQQLAQWRDSKTSILNKLASFELCDPQQVIDRISGVTVEKKASVDAEYSKPPTWLVTQPTREKTAAAYKLPTTEKQAYVAEPVERVERAFGAIQRTKQAADEARLQATKSVNAVRTKVAALVAYFQQPVRLPFKTVEAAARTYYGAGVPMLMDMVYREARLTEKRANSMDLLMAAIDHEVAPFTLIKAAIDLAAVAHQRQKIAADLQATIETTRTEQLRPFVRADTAVPPAPVSVVEKKAASIFAVKQAMGIGTEIAAIAAGDILAHKAVEPGSEEDDPYGDIAGLEEEIDTVRRQAASPRLSFQKRGFLGMGVGAAIGSSLGRTMSSLPKPKEDLINDDWMKLEDPEHENDLRKIRAHAMINQLMTDPDDPISGHDPDRVLSAYNEISSATPRLAENIAMLRPALRKRLEGHQEPFEAKELLDIEHGLARTKLPTPNTSVLSETPEKMMG